MQLLTGWKIRHAIRDLFINGHKYTCGNHRCLECFLYVWYCPGNAHHEVELARFKGACRSTARNSFIRRLTVFIVDHRGTANFERKITRIIRRRNRSRQRAEPTVQCRILTTKAYTVTLLLPTSESLSCDGGQYLVQPGPRSPSDQKRWSVGLFL